LPYKFGSLNPQSIIAHTGGAVNCISYCLPLLEVFLERNNSISKPLVRWVFVRWFGRGGVAKQQGDKGRLLLVTEFEAIPGSDKTTSPHHYQQHLTNGHDLIQKTKSS
jgi:hypothetical protein